MITQNDLKNRKNYLQLVAIFLLLPSLLILIHWINYEKKETKWGPNLLTLGTGLIILGCLVIIIFEMINKNIGAINMGGIMLNGFGGALYLIGTINIPGNFSNIGLNSLIGCSALVLAGDCSTYIYFKRPMHLLLWLYPLLLASFLVFGYMLYDNIKNIKNINNLKWWELTGEMGFGIIVLSILLIYIFALCTNHISKQIIKFFMSSTWLACIIILIYFGSSIANYVDVASEMGFFIALSFLIISQISLLFKNDVLDDNELYHGNAIQLESLVINE